MVQLDWCNHVVAELAEHFIGVYRAECATRSW
jgi:hypothetical protein